MNFEEAANQISPNWDGVVEIGFDHDTNRVLYVWPQCFKDCVTPGRFTSASYITDFKTGYSFPLQIQHFGGKLS